MGKSNVTQNSNWNAYIKVTSLFDTQTPKAMEYVKFKQGCCGLDFRFGHDYNLALAWMYTSIRHRGPALVYKCRASEQV